MTATIPPSRQDPRPAAPELQLALFQEAPGSRTVEWLIQKLTGRDWTTSIELCELAQLEPNRVNRTRFTAIAEASEGRICGHQKGFKLVISMTKDEFTWWENETLKTIAAKKTRLIQSQRVFYAHRKAA